MKIRLQNDVRKNTYNEVNKTITISQNRIEAIAYLSTYYEGLFMNNPAYFL